MSNYDIPEKPNAATPVASDTLFTDYCPFEGQTYEANLQQAIEHHCRGEAIPEALAKRCPHHAKMLNAALK